jgi:hypothetical protein
MPGLSCVRFFDKRNGVVVGDTGGAFPTGLFTTDDAGVTWKPVEGTRKPGWLAADFANTGVGILAGRWGSLATLRDKTLAPAEAQQQTKNIRRVQIQENRAWACGERGLLVQSQDGGQRWTKVNLTLPAELADVIDFNTLHFVGDFGWVAGRPGSVVFHTWDGGMSWQALNTGQSAPLHGIHFVNEKRGWAVGALGTILHTLDGGRSWKVQRRGGHRLAVLWITGNAERVNPAVLALLGKDEGYLCGVLQLASSDPHSARPERATEGDRLEQAVRLAGGTVGELSARFPLPDHSRHVDATALARGWSGKDEEARGLVELQRQIALALRLWRPDVVLTDNPDPRTSAGQLGAITALVVNKAAKQSGNSDAFPEQLAKLDLQPWMPSKVYGLWESGEGAHVQLDVAMLRHSLFGSALDYASPAHALLVEDPTVSMPHPAFRLLASSLDGADQHRALLQEINLHRGGQARRKTSPTIPIEEDRWEKIVKASRARRDLVALTQKLIGDPTKSQQMLANVEQSLTGLSEDAAGEITFKIGWSYVNNSQWSMAKEIFVLMLDKFPTHRLAPEAARWLIQYGASSEARRREELGQWVSNTSYEFTTENSNPTPNVQLPRAVVNRGRETVLFRRKSEIRQWNKVSLAVGEHMSAYGPLYYTDPTLQFPLQSAHRHVGDSNAANLWYTQFKLTQTGGAWFDAASTELWLSKKTGVPPKPNYSCYLTAKPPLLDGKLDDPCWADAKPIEFKNAVGETSDEYATEGWMRCDSNYLFLALRCKHPEGIQQAPITPRPRDPDLRAFDRVSLQIDLDRDYATLFQFQMDQRGCVAEDCWGDAKWNPKWYVAVHSEATQWQIEAAIPMVELTGDTRRAGQTWAFNLVRTIPGKGVQSYSGPADSTPRPEGMGLITLIEKQ